MTHHPIPNLQRLVVDNGGPNDSLLSVPEFQIWLFQASDEMLLLNWLPMPAIDDSFGESNSTYTGFQWHRQETLWQQRVPVHHAMKIWVAGLRNASVLSNNSMAALCCNAIFNLIGLERTVAHCLCLEQTSPGNGTRGRPPILCHDHTGDNRSTGAHCSSCGGHALSSLGTHSMIYSSQIGTFEAMCGSCARLRTLLKWLHSSKTGDNRCPLSEF